jgi:hypothetical protein
LFMIVAIVNPSITDLERDLTATNTPP